MKNKNPRAHRTLRKELTHKATRRFGRQVKWFEASLLFVDTGHLVPMIPMVSKTHTKHA